MDDDLTYIRSMVAAYADYADEDAARLTDQQIRAHLGERLVGTRERIVPTGPILDRLDAVIFHCEFGDQHQMRALGLSAGHLDLAALHAADRVVLTLVERAATVGGEDLPAYLDSIDAALATRVGAFTR